MAFLNGWLYKKSITIDQTKIDADLTDLTVLVKLTSANFDFSKALTTGNDIRFTASDGTTLLKYERRRHDDTNDLAEYIVKIPSVSGSVDTVFYMYYGNSGASDGSDAANAYDANFTAVLPLNDDNSDTIVIAIKGNNGTKRGNAEPAQADGKISKCQDFDGTNDYIDTTNTIATRSAYTFDAWVNSDNVAEATKTQNIFYGQGGFGGLDIFNSLLRFNTYYDTTVSLEAAITNGWHYVVLVANYAGNSKKMYIDGAEVDSDNYTPSQDNTVQQDCGGYESAETLMPFNGKIENWRISDTNRSAAWIKANYNSFNNTLITIGAEIAITLKTLTERVIPNHILLKLTTRAFILRVVATSTKILLTSKTFTARIVALSSKLLSTAKTFISRVGVNMKPSTILNGHFDTTANWEFNSPWTFSNSLAHWTAGGVEDLKQENVFTVRRRYRICFTVQSFSGTGTCGIKAGILTQNKGQVSGNGRYEIVGTALSTQLIFVGGSANSFDLDDVIVTVYNDEFHFFLSRALTSLVSVATNLAKITYKTFTNALSIASTVLFTTAKTLVQSIVVASVFVSYKVILETYTEIINIISPATTRVLSALRIISETISVSSSVVKSIGRSFSQSIVVASQNIFSMARVLTERVVAIPTGIFAQMITLTSRLIVSSTRTVMRAKIITQSIEVVSSLLMGLVAYKTISEVVSVSFSKLTSISRLFRQTLRVTPLLAKKAGKTFVEVLTGATSWLFAKTQFVELTENLTATVSFVKTSSKTFVQTIRVLPLFTYALARVFLENVAMGVNFLIARAYEFTETIKIVLAFGSFAIGKLLRELVPVHLIFNEGRNTIFTETIQVASNMVLQTAKIFSEVINAIGAMAGNAMARVFSQRVVAGATTLFKKTQHRILADSVKFAGQAYKMAGKTFAEAIAAVSALGSWAIGKVIVQRVIVMPDYSKAWTLSRVLSEMLAVTGNAFNQAGKTFTETIEVVSTFVLGTISKLLTETINIVEKVNKSLPARVFSEVVSVSVNLVNQNIKIFVETIAVVGEFVLGTISKLLLETVNIVAEYTKVWELSRTFTEIVGVAGNAFNQAGKIFTEVVNVTGTFILGTISKVLIEVVAVAFKFNVAMTRILTEFMIIVGRSTYQTGRIFTEVLNVINPLIAKLTGRIFTQRVIARWDKTKFVLNGIQVGLWKKVARVTNGVWKKISRNDN